MQPIYLVEDNVHDAELVIAFIKHSGLENTVIHFESPSGAIEEVKRITALESVDSLPVVILLDVIFPGDIDGLQFLTFIRSNEFTSFVPTLVMTSSSYDESIKVAYELGANDYIVKPVTADKLLLALQTLGLKWRIFT